MFKRKLTCLEHFVELCVWFLFIFYFLYLGHLLVLHSDLYVLLGFIFQASNNLIRMI